MIHSLAGGKMRDYDGFLDLAMVRILEGPDEGQCKWFRLPFIQTLVYEFVLVPTSHDTMSKGQIVKIRYNVLNSPSFYMPTYRIDDIIRKVSVVEMGDLIRHPMIFTQ